MEQIFHCENTRPRKEHVYKLVHHHEIVDFETEIDHMVRSGCWTLKLFFEVRLIL